VTTPNIVNIHILKGPVGCGSLQAGKLAAHQCRAQTKLLWICQAKPFLCGILNCNDIFYPDLAGNEYSLLAIFFFLPPAVNTPAFILRLQREREKESLALGFGPMVTEDCFVDCSEATVLQFPLCNALLKFIETRTNTSWFLHHWQWPCCKGNNLLNIFQIYTAILEIMKMFIQPIKQGSQVCEKSQLCNLNNKLIFDTLYCGVTDCFRR